MNKVIEVEKDKIISEMKEEIEEMLKLQKETIVGVPVKNEHVKVEVQEVLDDEKNKTFWDRNLILAGIPEPDTHDLDVGNTGELKYASTLFNNHMKEYIQDYQHHKALQRVEHDRTREK